MNNRVFRFLVAFAFGLSLSGMNACAQDDATVAEIKSLSEKVATAFNAGKADEVAALFAEKSELIDEQGVVYQGREEIKELIKAFMEKFPSAKFSEEIESIRLVGPVAVKEGTRIFSTSDQSNTSRIRFISTYAKGNGGWEIVSIRDFPDEASATPNELLQPLQWLIGDWVNEGADARVKISYRWSEDKNFILGEFDVKRGDEPQSTSSQRIGWDPLLNKPRSWMFDSDGGYAEGIWTSIDDGWVVNSAAVMPDGLTGSALLKLTPKENGRYTIAGTNRVVGDALEEDFEITIVKQPPEAKK